MKKVAEVNTREYFYDRNLFYFLHCAYAKTFEKKLLYTSWKKWFKYFTIDSLKDSTQEIVTLTSVQLYLLLRQFVSCYFLLILIVAIPSVDLRERNQDSSFCLSSRAVWTSSFRHWLKIICEFRQVEKQIWDVFCSFATTVFLWCILTGEIWWLFIKFLKSGAKHFFHRACN